MQQAWTWKICLLALLAVLATPALAEGGYQAPFDEKPVSLDLLSATRGGSAAYAPLSTGRVTSMAAETARSDFRFSGLSGQYQMDFWWGTLGTALIVDSVRRGGAL